ncbi:MAG: imidazolonepropionase [Thermoleophilia bacterium]|nr:imidazolonepropionase [Gaiellaceae bacterium]MDW8338377.1 imidazolonepropionase [Thermoleophilia bacterium]
MLLVRDLAQIATPAGARAPLRGSALRAVRVVEDGFVLCDGDRILAVGEMRALPQLPADVEELDGRGLSAIPGLVDCHTHACFAGDRVEEFALRAAGASYEELHAAGGGILATVRATRAAGEAALVEAVERHVGWMLEAGTTTFEAKSGYGLDRETELAQLRAIAAAHGIPTWLGAHAVPPEHADADAYLDFLLAEVLPEVTSLAEAADVFLERGAFDAAQARRYLEACRAAGLALRLHGDQFTEAGAVPLAVELGARSVDHLEATGPSGVALLAASDVTAVLLPASALVLGRPMPPARALVDAGAAVALATDLNPGSAFCESLPLVMSLACTQLRLTPEEALAACTVNAAHVLGLAERKGRLLPGLDADLVLLAAEDWRHVAYHLAGPVVHTVIRGGEVAWRRSA